MISQIFVKGTQNAQFVIFFLKVSKPLKAHISRTKTDMVSTNGKKLFLCFQWSFILANKIIIKNFNA